MSAPFRIKPITTELEYQKAQNRIQQLLAAAHDTSGGNERAVLQILIKDYENIASFVFQAEYSPVEIKKLGILFGDNDFSQVIKSVLTIFLKGNYCIFTKREIVQLFNQIAGAVTWIHTGSRKRQNEQYFPKYPYLHITEKSVFINEEVDQFIVKTSGDCNCEFVYIDRDPPKDCPNIFCF